MSTATTQARSTRGLLQTLTLVIGVVFLLVGIAGFIPGVTTNYHDLTFAGHHSDAKLIGIFQVSVFHNIVHLLFGIIGVASARTARASRMYLIVGGVVYLVLWIYGLIMDPMSGANFVPLNTADNWLHFGLGVGMIAIGLVVGRSASRAVRTA